MCEARTCLRLVRRRLLKVGMSVNGLERGVEAKKQERKFFYTPTPGANADGCINKRFAPVRA